MKESTLLSINDILNEWASKFGTTVEKLIPEMQKYYIVQYTVTVIAWLCIFIIMLLIGRILINKHTSIIKEGNRDYDDLHVIGYVFWGFSIIPFVVICYFLTTLLQWIFSPSAALIDKIMQIVSVK